MLALASCRESEKVYIYPPSPMEDARDFVEKYGPVRQVYSMTTSELPRTITLVNGSKVTVPHAAIQKNGDYVSGEIILEAYEMLKRSDIMLGGINTNHYDGSPIETKGILDINILSAGKYADKNLLNLMTVSIPSGQSGFMRIASGNTNTDGTGFLSWGPGMLDSVNSDGNAYTFKSMKLGWLNCGAYFAHDVATGSLSVTLQNHSGTIASYRGEHGNTFVYFCPKGSKVAMQLTSSVIQDVVKCKDYMLPVGKEGKLVAFSIKDRKFYYAEKEFTTTDNNMQSLSLSEVSINDLLVNLRSLDTY